MTYARANGGGQPHSTPNHEEWAFAMKISPLLESHRHGSYVWVLPFWLSSQVAWYRMETGQELKMGKKWPKNRNGPWPEIRENSPKWRENRTITQIPFFRHSWAIFPPCRAVGQFLFFSQFFPILGVGPFFHSIPDRLTRNSWPIHLQIRCIS